MVMVVMAVVPNTPIDPVIAADAAAAATITPAVKRAERAGAHPVRRRVKREAKALPSVHDPPARTGPAGTHAVATAATHRETESAS